MESSYTQNSPPKSYPKIYHPKFRPAILREGFLSLKKNPKNSFPQMLREGFLLPKRFVTQNSFPQFLSLKKKPQKFLPAKLREAFLLPKKNHPNSREAFLSPQKNLSPKIPSRKIAGSISRTPKMPPKIPSRNIAGSISLAKNYTHTLFAMTL
jgi:hypothetical protein